MQGNISENYEFMKQKLRIARYGIHESSYELAKLRISKATNFEGYEFRGIPVTNFVKRFRFGTATQQIV